MLDRIETREAIRGLRNLARKNTETEDVDVLLAENMGVDKSVIERIALGEGTQGDFILAGAALTRLAAEMESEDVAEKSNVNAAQGDSPRSNRDAIGRAVTKPYGSAPRDVRARESARADRSGERLPDGRSRRKMYS